MSCKIKQTIMWMSLGIQILHTEGRNVQKQCPNGNRKSRCPDWAKATCHKCCHLKSPRRLYTWHQVRSKKRTRWTWNTFLYRWARKLWKSSEAGSKRLWGQSRETTIGQRWDNLNIKNNTPEFSWNEIRIWVHVNIKNWAGEKGLSLTVD